MPASFATIEQDDHDSPSVVRSLVLASACKSIQLSAQREIDIVPLHWLERVFSDRPSFLLATPPFFPVPSTSSPVPNKLGTPPPHRATVDACQGLSGACLPSKMLHYV